MYLHLIFHQLSIVHTDFPAGQYMMSSTSNASAAQPTVFLGDDFSNNLFSDLAPLLTLFGEQVTKQFLSLSMGWADSFLLAMAPIGIMTVVVSAIRVGGARQLKAIVGR